MAQINAYMVKQSIQVWVRFNTFHILITSQINLLLNTKMSHIQLQDELCQNACGTMKTADLMSLIHWLFSSCSYKTAALKLLLSLWACLKLNRWMWGSCSTFHPFWLLVTYLIPPLMLLHHQIIIFGFVFIVSKEEENKAHVGMWLTKWVADDQRTVPGSVKL